LLHAGIHARDEGRGDLAAAFMTIKDSPYEDNSKKKKQFIFLVAPYKA
jgi:hypothetical protein